MIAWLRRRAATRAAALAEAERVEDAAVAAFIEAMHATSQRGRRKPSLRQMSRRVGA